MNKLLKYVEKMGLLRNVLKHVFMAKYVQSSIKYQVRSKQIYTTNLN